MQHDFHYIPKKDPKVKKAYGDILNILKEAQDLVSEEFTFRFDVVGSYKRNMITYDAKSNVGYEGQEYIHYDKTHENIHGVSNRMSTICCLTKLIGLKRIVYGMLCGIYTLRRKIGMIIRMCIQEVFLP